MESFIEEKVCNNLRDYFFSNKFYTRVYDLLTNARKRIVSFLVKEQLNRPNNGVLNWKTEEGLTDFNKEYSI